MIPRSLYDMLPFTGYGGAYSPTLFPVVLALSTLFDLWIAHHLLFSRRTFGNPEGGLDPLRLTHVVILLIVCGVLFVSKAVLFRVIGIGAFGMINVAWHGLVYVAPICGVRALLALRRREVSRPVVVVALLAVSFVPVAAYARFVEPVSLRVERTEVGVDAARAGRANVRILVLSDLQTDQVTEYERDVFDRIEAEKPDVILIPGDLFHGTSARFRTVREPLNALLRRLDAPGGVFLVRGDVDPPHHLDPLLEGTKIRFLENETVTTEIGDRTFTICGLARHERTPAARAAVAELEARGGETDVRIVMAHHPDAVDLLGPRSRVDLVVAGHTHGGQVVIPGFGPPITLSSLPRRIAAGGLHERNGNSVYVSRGVGHERGQAPRIRFLAPPELTVLTVTGTGEAE